MTVNFLLVSCFSDGDYIGCSRNQSSRSSREQASCNRQHFRGCCCWERHWLKFSKCFPGVGTPVAACVCVLRHERSAFLLPGECRPSGSVQLPKATHNCLTHKLQRRLYFISGGGTFLQCLGLRHLRASLPGAASLPSTFSWRRARR